jgi:anti-anti-sigma factor
MHIETRKVSGARILDTSGRVDFRTAGDAGDRIVAMAQGTGCQAALNLTLRELVNSTGHRVIVLVEKLHQVRHGQLTICGTTGGVNGVLQTDGIRSLLRFFDNEQEAAASFSA